MIINIRAVVVWPSEEYLKFNIGHRFSLSPSLFISKTVTKKPLVSCFSFIGLNFLF